MSSALLEALGRKKRDDEVDDQEEGDRGSDDDQHRIPPFCAAEATAPFFFAGSCSGFMAKSPNGPNTIVRDLRRSSSFAPPEAIPGAVRNRRSA
jgi:hypothetical protein